MGSPTPASRIEIAGPLVSTVSKRSLPGAVTALVAARKPTPRWRFLRTRSRPPRKAFMPPRTSSAIARHAPGSAIRRASGSISAAAGSRAASTPSMTKSQLPLAHGIQSSADRLPPIPRIAPGDQVAEPGNDRLDEAVAGREVLERIEVAHLPVLVEPVAAHVRPADEGLRAAEDATLAEARL